MVFFSEVDIFSLLINYLSHYKIRRTGPEDEFILCLTQIQTIVNKNPLAILDLSSGLKARYKHSIEDYYNDIR
jgi:hypothetical protein